MRHVTASPAAPERGPPGLAAALRDDARFVLLALAAALALRLLYEAVGVSVPWADTRTYMEAGQDLWAGRTMRSDIVMPIYPLLLAAVGWEAVRPLQALLSALTVPLVYLLALQVFERRAVARWAAALMCIEPLSVFYANQRMTETLFVFMLCAALLALYRRRLLLASCVLALSVLVRPSIELLAPLLVLWFAATQAAERKPAAALRGLTLYVLVYVLAMTPWWLHNAHKYGRFVRLNLGDGIVLRMEHNPVFVEHGFWAQLDFVSGEFADEPDPIERNRKRREAALAFIREDPLRYAVLSARRLGRYWSPVIDQSEGEGFLRRARWPFFVLASVVYAGLVAYALQRRERPWRRLAPLLLVIGYLTLVHVAMNALVRYRAPLMPLVAVISAAGWERAVRRRRTSPGFPGLKRPASAASRPPAP